MAIMFALALGLAVSCGGSGSSGGGGNYSVPSAPTQTGTSSLSLPQKTEVEAAVQAQVQSIASIVSGLGMTATSQSKVAATIPEMCQTTSYGECSIDYCVKGNATTSGGSVSVYVKNLPITCGGETITKFAWSYDYNVSGDEITVTWSGGIEGTGEGTDTFNYNVNQAQITYNTATSKYSDFLFDYELPDIEGTGKDIRVFFETGSSGSLTGWVSEDGVKVATIGGTVDDVSITWLP